MDVGILGGTGPAGRGLAIRLAAAGVTVTLGSRDEARAAEAALELTASWASRDLAAVEGSDNAAAAGADLVVVATPWDSAVGTVRPLADLLAGKVVVSMANALVKQGREMHPLFPPLGSLTAAVQGALPRSLVAGSFHHLPAGDMADLDVDLVADVLICSDHPRATEATAELIDRISGLRSVDAGGLSQAAAIEAFTSVLITLNIRHKAHTTLRLAGLEG